ncbi:hypothetical protein [Fulvitalea axinellae]|uniref:hypothetical protein n=1 Tax=Fulvitalea axinellae TaxID=1182444 RepID=UPI0030CA53C9
MQRYIYSGEDSITPVEHYEELPKHVQNLIEAITDNEEKESLKATVRAIITDPEVPVRLNENSSLDDLKAQIAFSFPDPKKIEEYYTPDDILIGTKWAQQAIAPHMRTICGGADTPIFLDDILEKLQVHTGKIRPVKNKPPDELSTTDCLGLWLSERVPPLPPEHTPQERAKWERVVRRQALHYLTRIAKKPISVHFMTERMDEARLMDDGVEERTDLDPAYFDMLEIHRQHMTYKGLHPHEEDLMDLSRVYMYKYGEQTRFPWIIDSDLWSHRQTFKFANSWKLAPGKIDRMRDGKTGAEAGQEVETAKKEELKKAEYGDFEPLTREELCRSFFDPSFCGEILTFDQFQERLKLENSRNYPTRRQLVPELTLIEARLQEYEFAKERANETKRQLDLAEKETESRLDSERQAELVTARKADAKITQSRFELLDLMEHDIYAWHRRCPLLSFYYLPVYHKSLLLLLDSIHKEHMLLVKHAMRERHHPWIPDYESLAETERVAVRESWENLAFTCEEAPDLSVIQDEVPSHVFFTKRIEGFRPMVMSSVARLLSRPFGRCLICSIAGSSSRKLSVEPADRGSKSSNACVMPLSFLPHSPTPVEEFSKERPFVGLKPAKGCGGQISVMVPWKELLAIYGEHWRVIKDPRHVELPDNTKKKKDKKGDEKLVTPEMERQGYYVPRSGNYVLSPTFVTFGHEAGHVQSYHSGESRTRLFKETYKEDPDFCPWNDNEEHFVIEEVENRIRGEHGLPLRKWHKSGAVDLQELISDPKAYQKFFGVLR